MGIRRSKNHQGIQICWFDPLLFNQNWINFEKPSKKCWFLCTFMVFQEFFNPGWKVADQTQIVEFLEVFRFFWHQCCQQEWRNSGWNESWAKIPVWKSPPITKALLMLFCYAQLLTWLSEHWTEWLVDWKEKVDDGMIEISQQVAPLCLIVGILFSP